MNTINKRLPLINILKDGQLELVNFNNVAKINLQYEGRILLNFNHTITRGIAGKDESGTFGGYYYIDRDLVSNYDEILQLIDSADYRSIFIPTYGDGHKNGYVNVNEISTIKISPHKLNVIFNLSHSVTSKRAQSKGQISADSLICSFRERAEFENYVNSLANEY